MRSGEAGRRDELSAAELAELVDWRRELHRWPEISGEEVATARAVTGFLAPTAPDAVLTGLGGHGVAAVFAGAEPGPTLLFRAELDALPIPEQSGAAHSSLVPGKGHLCGHDGHMAALAAMALALGRRRPARGRVVLLFQPAEETGAGAAAVLADPRFAAIAPDVALAWHNMPGLPFGHAALAEGPVMCASLGLRLILSGKTSHASAPEAGVSPAAAMLRLVPGLTALGAGGALLPGYQLVTVTHARLGEPAFGIAPGLAEVWATLRCLRDTDMAALLAEAEALAKTAARENGLGLKISHHDIFHSCANDPEATAMLRRALQAEGCTLGNDGLPIRASEDFGRFGAVAKSAMVMLGAGEAHPMLHNPDYDFPDALIGIAARVMLRVVRQVLGTGAPDHG